MDKHPQKSPAERLQELAEHGPELRRTVRALASLPFMLEHLDARDRAGVETLHRLAETLAVKLAAHLDGLDVASREAWQDEQERATS